MGLYILHFLTGTMAFRGSRPSRRRSGADIPDAILEKCSAVTNRNARKAAKIDAYARIMQDGDHKPKKRTTTPENGGKNTQGRNGFGERSIGPKNPAG
jgi:hypothetical protein